MRLIFFILIACTTFKANAAQMNSSDQHAELSFEQMSMRQKSAYLGKNLVRISLACPVSANALVAGAIAETFPLFNLYPAVVAYVMVDNYSESRERAYKESMATYIATGAIGGAGSVAADIASVGYLFIFDDTGNALSDAIKFPTAQSGYASTIALTQYFYGDQENSLCAGAGRAIVDVLTYLSNLN